MLNVLYSSQMGHNSNHRNLNKSEAPPVCPVDPADPGARRGGGPSRQPGPEGRSAALQAAGAPGPGHSAPQLRRTALAPVCLALWQRAERQPGGQRQGPSLSPAL